MTTLVSVTDYNNNFVLSVKDNFALDIGLLDADTEFRYSFGTSDVKKLHCKHNIINFVKALKKSLLNRRRVGSVIISTEVEYARFNDPILTFDILGDNEYYVEIASQSVDVGLVTNGNYRINKSYSK